MNQAKSRGVLILGECYTEVNHEKLKDDIVDLCEEGYRTFYTTLYTEFDFVAAEIILSLRDGDGLDNFVAYPDIEIVVVIERFCDILTYRNREQAVRFVDILDKATHIVLTKHVTPLNPIAYCSHHCSKRLNQREWPKL